MSSPPATVLLPFRVCPETFLGLQSLLTMSLIEARSTGRLAPSGSVPGTERKSRRRPRPFLLRATFVARDGRGNPAVARRFRLRAQSPASAQQTGQALHEI